jgi:hypothetical protein
MLIRSIQDAVLGSGRYGVAVQLLLNGRGGLEQAAELYDKIANQNSLILGGQAHPLTSSF